MRATLGQTTVMPPALSHAVRILLTIAAAGAWGLACHWLGAPFAIVLLGGLAAAGLGFWLERDVLAGPETRGRKDFALIAAAGYGFLAIVGVGLVSLADLAAGWMRL